MSRLIEIGTAADGVTVLTLNDPRRRNAMSPQMGEDLRQAIVGLEEAGCTRALVLAGAGEDFSAGGELGMLEQQSAAAQMGTDVAPFMRGFYDSYLCLRQAPFPVLAAVQGNAIGAGLALALACDVRLLADDARLSMNFLRLGIHPGMGASWTLPHVVGAQRAVELFFTGRSVTADEAVDIGMALQRVPRANLFGTAVELAAGFAETAPRASAQLLKLLRGPPLRFEDQLDREAIAQNECFAAGDVVAGLANLRRRD